MGRMRRSGVLTRSAPADPRTAEGLFRGAAADRVPALLAALALGLIAPLGTHVAEPAPEPAPPPVVAQAPVRVVTPVVLTDLPSTGPDDRRIALTFDDGPDPTWTPQILDLLIAHGARATFCMVGEQMAKHPEIVERVVNAGMGVCAHSRTHDEELPDKDPQTIAAEIGDVATRVPAGTVVTTFRAPGGNWKPNVLDAAVAQHLQPLGWAVDPRDWKKPGADAVVAAVEKQIHPGAVILLHDGGGSRAQTVEALRTLLPRLAAQGYTTALP
ncbi:Peptidoglycan/xylan/chitin deacetylase, PgdA/CDA1 family [Pseudonocardia oroxyli]|uniref:Peptidoglycan/xylan/chitin deacetylase, PgdA/CDA1 family n=2 Tax=Pseudonocardia oroxyli TaxID=366584 RepID=A0A1G7ZU63_PSEOR|nr:Peptidoglycan/xylan/chitin deacetylase, PgdA/CDA1 family [Pseudonocardia oroxyli]